jgi:3-hydroxyacyl-CoA dehydrogenase/enoyl-CoA hydratase/3-hydroxybutyryl-CoA epimerase
MKNNLSIEIDADGIAVIVWDMPGRSMNVLDERSIEDFRAMVERVLSEPRIRGAVVASGKDSFLAGADLGTIDRLLPDAALPEAEKARRIYDEVMVLQSLYRRLETGGKPFVAAINGTARHSAHAEDARH